MLLNINDLKNYLSSNSHYFKILSRGLKSNYTIGKLFLFMFFQT